MKKNKYVILLSLLLVFPLNVKAEQTIDDGSLTAPVGTISVYAGLENNNTLKNQGYLLADGSSLLKSEYPDLFRTIGTTYGTVDSDHFNLPNLNGRTVVGMDSSDNDFNSLGKKAGEKSVTLTVAQLPKHTHTFVGSETITSKSTAHNHSFSGTTSLEGAHSHLTTISSNSFITVATSGTGSLPRVDTTFTSGVNYYATSSAGAHSHTYSGVTEYAGAHTHTVTPTGTNSNVGSGAAHNNMQPYIVLKYIIKFK